MAIYNWLSATSGSWNTPTAWDPTGGPQVNTLAFFPGSFDTAVFATGSKTPYTVTGNGDAHELDVSGDHVTFANFSFVNEASGAPMVVENHAKVTIAADSMIGLTNHDAYSRYPLTVDNATLKIEGDFYSLVGNISDHGLVVVSGSKAYFGGFFLSNGLSVDATSTVSVINGASFTGTANIFAGHAVVSGTGSEITLSGTFAGSGRAAPGGTLALNQLDGSVTLAGGTLSADTIATGAQVSGFGTISTALTNNGTISATAGVLTLQGAVTGSGTLAIISAATLALEATTSETIKFSASNATLQLAPNIGATGFLRGFRSSDKIDIRGADITSVDLSTPGSNTVLKAFAGAVLVDSFTIAGHIPQGSIGLSSDSTGGTLLTYEPTTALVSHAIAG